MPTVIYKGSHKAGRNMGRLGRWSWGVPEDRSQEWVDRHAKALVGEFMVDGVMFTDGAAETIATNTPDMGWKKGDIMTWMDEKGITYSAMSTKATLLKKITESLTPSIEESLSEGVMDEITGDD